MPKFAANLSMMFAELPFAARFAAARQAGFEAVEFLFPYEHDARDIAGWVKENALEISVFNFPPGDWTAGERGLSALPGREAEFLDSAKHVLAYGAEIGARRLHCMAGVAAPGRETEQVFVDNIRRAADLAGAAGIEVMIEPINPRDMPGYFLTTTAQAMTLLERIDHPGVSLQFDIYHHQITRGDVIRTLETIHQRIGHIQIAGVPERHEPDGGELAYGPIFAALDRLGYDGWVGCEYRPRGDTVAGLGWRDALV